MSRIGVEWIIPEVYVVHTPIMVAIKKKQDKAWEYLKNSELNGK